MAIEPTSRGPEWEAIYRDLVRREPPRPGSSDFADLTVEMMGRIWSRGELSMRERRLVVITLLTVEGLAAPLESHVYSALESGDLSMADLDELCLQLAMYAGWPRAKAMRVVVDGVRAARAARD